MSSKRTRLKSPGDNCRVLRKLPLRRGGIAVDWRSVATGAGTLRPRQLTDETLRVGDVRLFASKGSPGHPLRVRFGGMTTGLVLGPRGNEASCSGWHDGAVETACTASLLRTSRWEDDIETSVLLGAIAGSESNGTPGRVLGSKNSARNIRNIVIVCCSFKDKVTDMMPDRVQQLDVMAESLTRSPTFQSILARDAIRRELSPKGSI